MLTPQRLRPVERIMLVFIHYTETSSSSDGGDHDVSPGQLRDVVSPAPLGASKDHFMERDVQNTSRKKPQVDPLKRCLSYLSWYFSMWVSNGNNPSSSQVTELP